MRYLIGFLCVCGLGVLPLVGCSETDGGGGNGGTAGTGGSAGSGGSGGLGGTGGMDAFPCTEQGIRDAIAEGGGPHFFACDGPTTLVTAAEIVIDNDVILDGEGSVTLDGSQEHRVFAVAVGTSAELRRFTLTRGLGYNGGGLLNDGTLTLTESTVSGNSAAGRVDSRGGGISNNGTLTLTNSTVSDNTSSTAGGGISNSETLTLTNSAVSENVAAYGGGISNSGTLTLADSTVSGNDVGYDGGGIYNETFAAITLTDSTVSGNTAIWYGGGLYNGGLGTVVLTNSTVSGNSGAYGGGIYDVGSTTITLTNCTLSANTGSYGSGINNLGTLTLRNTLVDNDCADGSASVSVGGNIESPGDTCGFDQLTDQVNVTEGQLNIGPLSDNGGATMTHALLPGSVAIDVIPEGECTVDTDQRGQPRPETSGTMCDVGAFEVQP